MVTPLLTVILQMVYAGRAFVCAWNSSIGFCPDVSTVLTNAVPSQPVSRGDEIVLNENPGKVKLTESPIASCWLIANDNVTAVAAEVTGLFKLRLICMKLGVVGRV